MEQSTISGQKRQRQAADVTDASDPSEVQQALERVGYLIQQKLSAARAEGSLHPITYGRIYPEHPSSSITEHMNAGNATFHFTPVAEEDWRALPDGSEGVEACTDTHDNDTRNALCLELAPSVLKIWLAAELRGGPRHVVSSPLHLATLLHTKCLRFTVLLPENRAYFAQQGEGCGALSLDQHLATRSPNGDPHRGVLQGSFQFGVPDELAVELSMMPSGLPLTPAEVQAAVQQVRLQRSTEKYQRKLQHPLHRQRQELHRQQQ